MPRSRRRASIRPLNCCSTSAASWSSRCDAGVRTVLRLLPLLRRSESSPRRSALVQSLRRVWTGCRGREHAPEQQHDHREDHAQEIGVGDQPVVLAVLRAPTELEQRGRRVGVVGGACAVSTLSSSPRRARIQEAARSASARRCRTLRGCTRGAAARRATSRPAIRRCSA